MNTRYQAITECSDQSRLHYTLLVERLMRRYTSNGQLVISIGGKPTRYARLERAAFDRYVIGQA